MAKFLEVVRCSKHGTKAITFQDLDSSEIGGGFRLTPDKCCGTWDVTELSWAVNNEELKSLIENLSEYVEHE